MSAASIERYYRLHARLYDATRWSFLFGRAALIRELATTAAPSRILEVGCGTGKNLVALAAAFPHAAVTGVDLSEAMLAQARGKMARFGERVRLVLQAYGASPSASPGFDLVLFSYALSMFNPGYEEAIVAAQRDLAPGGRIAVVDFHATPQPLFARWMRVNHVRMEGHLRPALHAHFTPIADRLHRAYGGLWQYLMFIGQRAGDGHGGL